MVEVDATAERVDDVTFVQATVTNTRGTPQSVRVESTLEGDIWVPHRGDFPAPEWDGNCWEKGILPGETCGFGFASAADPVEPPVEIVSVERVSAENLETVEEVLASLDDAVPPRRVVEEEP